MKTIKHNKASYTLPEGWSEVKFSQFKELMKLNQDELGQLERAVRIVSVFSGVAYDTLVDEDPALIFRILHELDFLDTGVENMEPVMHFQLDGETYYVNDLENSAFREYVDFQTIEEKTKDKPEEGITWKLAILCRKQNEKPLKGKILEERASLFEKLDAETVLRINSFFLLKQRLYSEASLLYSNLEKEIKAKEEELRSLLTANGAGGRWLTKWRNRSLTFSLSMIRRLSTFWRSSNTR
ncbi:hypothetical protein [uncultured Pontibacter sp.]|uniref:hypothetical protein n=1 Tax=uncultured Pontibacter sp. TaxID=453356 RepID=UPI0026255EF1|nr:hypothetical protein [uncultured Pontibacter sp.]